MSYLKNKDFIYHQQIFQGILVTDTWNHKINDFHTGGKLGIFCHQFITGMMKYTFGN